MRYYIIAGEASGDLHGSNLMKELKVADHKADFRYFGGDLMQAVGGELVKHYREMAFMGILNVLLNIKTIKRNMEFCKKDLLDYKPDVLILIDYPGFNLRIAEFAKKHNIKVYYYISPKLWAWKEYRVKQIRAYVDEMFTIFPFETPFYKKHGIDVNYVGNPLMDSILEFRGKAKTKAEFLKEHDLDERPILALLSGSRKQEINYLLPVMKQAVNDKKDYQVVLAGVTAVDKSLYADILQGSNIKVIYKGTYDLLNNAHTALVASGTAVLETALFNIPQVALYKLEGGIVLHILKKIALKIKWVTLPNIILGREAVKELIQNDMKLKNVKTELNKLLTDKIHRNNLLKEYEELQNLMGDSGCSKRTAEKMFKLLTLNAKL